MNELRGREIAMIYQDALSSLNPSMLIRAQMKQLTKPWRHAFRRGAARARRPRSRSARLIPYPHELSGGQRQRVPHRHGA